MSMPESRFSEAVHPAFYNFAYGVVSGYMKRRGGLNVTGTLNMPHQGRVMLTANHEKKVDPFAIGIGYPRALRALAKKELLGPHYLYIGHLLSPLGTSFIDRDNVSHSRLRDAGNILNGNLAYLSFIEGTRKNEGEEIKAKEGVAWLALKASSESEQCPVLPIGLSTSEIVRGQPIQMVAGEVIYASGSATKKARQALTAEIASSLHDLTREAVYLSREGAGVPGQIKWDDPGHFLATESIHLDNRANDEISVAPSDSDS